jgi:hypothetical protein
VAGCLLLLLLANDEGLVASGVSGLASPASSQRLASTDLVTLLWRTIHWTALTWKPLPPHVCEHFDQGVRSHSNFKLSAFPFSRHKNKQWVTKQIFHEEIKMATGREKINIPARLLFLKIARHAFSCHPRAIGFLLTRNTQLFTNYINTGPSSPP